MRALFLLIFAAVLASGCGRETAGPLFPDEPPVSGVSSSEFDRWLDEKDRREMVRLAPAGWKPESAGTAAALKLIVKKSDLSMGQPLEYRLEFKNTGSEPILIADDRSIFKGSPNNDGGLFTVVIEDPAGNKISASAPLGGDGCVEDRASSRNAEHSERRRRFWAAVGRLNLAIQPGETLVSRSWHDDGGDLCGSANWKKAVGRLNRPTESAYRAMNSMNFPQPGKYRLSAVFRDKSGKIGTAENPAWAGGGKILISNPVEVLVKP